jgi:hypothetical protein
MIIIVGGGHQSRRWRRLQQFGAIRVGFAAVRVSEVRIPAIRPSRVRSSLGGLEARRQPYERVDSIGRGRDTEIHAGIELKVLAQFVREAGAEGDDVAARVLRVEAEPVRCLRLPGAVRSGLNSTTFPRRLP